MSDAQALLAGLTAGCALLALFGAWRQARRGRRRDLDAVGWIDWTTVQMAALIALAVLAGLAFKA